MVDLVSVVGVGLGGVVPDDARRAVEGQHEARMERRARVSLQAEGALVVVGLQEQVANHRKRLWSRAMVVSVTEKVPERHQV